MVAKRFSKYSSFDKGTIPIYYYLLWMVGFISFGFYSNLNQYYLSNYSFLENKIYYLSIFIVVCATYIAVIFNKIRGIDNIINFNNVNKSSPTSMFKYIKSWYNLILLLAVVSCTFGYEMLSMFMFLTQIFFLIGASFFIYRGLEQEKFI
jgi:hypothetical protein